MYFPSSRVEHKIGLAISRQLSKEKSTNSDDRTTTATAGEEIREQTHDMIFSAHQRRERSKRDSILEEEENRMDESHKAENTPSSRVSHFHCLHQNAGVGLSLTTYRKLKLLIQQRPLILRVPQTNTFSSLSDIMRRLQCQPSMAEERRKGSKATKSDLSQSMIDLSVLKSDTSHDERGTTLPRLQTSVCFDLLSRSESYVKYDA